MSNKAMNYVWTHSKQRGSALVVMLALSDMANDDGECYPGKAKLSEKCRMQVRNLDQTLNKLEDDGEILIIHRRVGHFNQSNVYRLIMDAESPDLQIGRGSDLQIGRWRSPDREGGDPQIGRPPDPQIGRSLIFNPNESINDPEPSTNPIMEALKKRGDLQ